MGAKFTCLVVDAADPARLADFWAAVLGWEREPPDPEDGSIVVKDPHGHAPILLFEPVPEKKSVKNRLHIDVNPIDGDQPDELARLLALGATHVDIGQGEQTWVVLADPEGNEFCLLRHRVTAAGS
jgi:predicted enzyme related to lactoylglutathione lyase